MGCSTLLDDANLWTAAAKEREIAAAAVTPAANDAKTPDIPPYVAKCVRYGLALSKQKQAQAKAKKTAQKAPAEGQGAAATPSADTLVLAELQTKDERDKCAAAVLAWYKQIQEANRKAAAAKAKTS